MHCPKCGQQQISDDTRFCSRCGFLLVGVIEVVANGGLIPANKLATRPRFGPTQRNNGIKKGLFIILMSFLLVPLVTIISIGLRAGPGAAIILAILLGVGGMLRMAYALLFESNEPLSRAPFEQAGEGEPLSFASGRTALNELPPHQSIPASAYVSPGTGAWRETNELSEPGSVTDSTTKLLQKDEQL